MVRKMSAAIAVLVATVSIPLTATGVAHAAPDCNSFTSYAVPGGYVRIPTIGWDTGNYNCELGRGNFGDAVRVLQVSMRSCAGQNIADDRDFGPKTEQALKNTQVRLGVPADGRYGPQTRRAGFRFALFPTFATWNPAPGNCWILTNPSIGATGANKPGPMAATTLGENGSLPNQPAPHNTRVR